MLADSSYDRRSTPSDHFFGDVLDEGGRPFLAPRDESNDGLFERGRQLDFGLDPVTVGRVHPGNDQYAVCALDLITETGSHRTLANRCGRIHKGIVLRIRVICPAEVVGSVEQIDDAVVRVIVLPCVTDEDPIRL